MVLNCEKAKEKTDFQKRIGQELEEKAKQEKTFVEIDELAPARLLDVPNNGSLIIRIPTGEKVEVIDSKGIKSGMTYVVWYKVNYKDNIGWISQHVTTGEMLKEKSKQ